MLAVAIFGAVVWIPSEIRRRRLRFLYLAQHHANEAAFERRRTALGVHWFDAVGRPLTERENAVAEWHWYLSGKYDNAAARPWMPLRPDPPQPK